MIKDCNLVNNLSTIDPKIFNEPAIYGIVGSKYFLATEKDINIQLDITTNIKEIQFPMPELSRILGILLDNAIEATVKSSTPYIFLEMRFDNKKCADIIKVSNTYDNTVEINTDDIYKKGFSTKIIKSGIGLWEVKNLIKKQHNSQIYTTIDNDKFSQTMIIEKMI